jgi:hypothetical protein
MQRTLLLYESRHGATEAIIKEMALVLGPSRACRVKDFKPEYKDFDFFLLASPVYNDRVDESLVEFVSANKDWLSKKPLALLCICLLPQQMMNYLEPFRRLLGGSILRAYAAGGRVRLDELDANERRQMKTLSMKTAFPYGDVDLVDRPGMLEYALQLKRLKETYRPGLASEELKRVVEEFLLHHNTCTLTTGWNSRVRSTPLEYLYSENHIYLFSEGGEKYANILLNPHVSLAVYEPFHGMEQLAGMQISGNAEVVEPGSDEYRRIAFLKGTNPESLSGLPVSLPAIKVRLIRAEFLWSGFADHQAARQQVFEF